MASSSSTHEPKYDVFLSFRGLDTRHNFVSHLYSALCSKGIYTFKDDVEMDKGDSIPDELVKAIQTSRFAIVVISENYATSSWCLEELRVIMDLIAVKEDKNVVPIFYRVEPGNVRQQRGSFAAAFSGMKRPQTDEKVVKWREALTRVANLSGYVSSTWVDEATMISDAVREISDRLFAEQTRDHVDIVRMRRHMEGLGSLLEMEFDEEVRIIGILGMEGVDKTTIAQYLYDKFSREFSARCFVDVKKIYRKEGLSYLKQHFLSKILGVEQSRLEITRAGSKEIKKRLKNQKVFVVLDDVDQMEQLHGLARETNWFGQGSRIIITTRDKGVLETCEVELVYPVTCLSTKDAVQMFKQIVFKGSPPAGFEQLLTRASRLAYGLPSALKAYSSLGWHRKSKKEWEKAVRKFEEVPHKNVVDILRSSYTDLSSEEKIAFCYVACLFNGDKILRVNTLLDDESSIQVLLEKSLVDKSAQGCINMHVLVAQMGRNMVLEESNYIPQTQRILWDPLKIYHVLRYKTVTWLSRFFHQGTERIEALTLHMGEMPEMLNIEGSSFTPMHNMKFIKFYTHVNVDDIRSNMKLLPHAASLPHMLKLLYWDAYPLKTLPPGFSPHCLVELTLRYSNLQILWRRRNLDLGKLKRLDVSGSKDLTELPDLSKAMQLEELVVEGCKKLIYLRELPQSLNYLNAHDCSSLETVSLPFQHSIKHIDLSDCLQLNQEEQLITHFLTEGQHDEETSLRFACIPQTTMPNYFDIRSRAGASIQLSANLVGFAACILVACKRPFHLQFSESSYSWKWETSGVFWINLKPHIYTPVVMEEEAMHYLVIIQVLNGINNDQAGNFLPALQLPPGFGELQAAEIIACGVHMNPMNQI